MSGTKDPLPNRKRNRLADFDYSTPGYYFITICTQQKRKILGEVVGGGVFDAPQMRLSPVGQIVQRQIGEATSANRVTVDKYVIMPNHIHMILLVNDGAEGGTSRTPSPTEERYRAQSGATAISNGYHANCQRPLAAGTSRTPSPTNAVVPHFVATWKRFCHEKIGYPIFQRSYHDHVIRGEEDYLKIWQYIDINPAKWKEDCFYIE